MAAVWNVVEIPFPGASCSVAVPASSSPDGCIQDLIRACENVLTSLRSKLLTVELNVLRSLLYVFHNRLRQHKPYLALKQVEQCIKRLHDMKLSDSIQDLIELCPSEQTSFVLFLSLTIQYLRCEEFIVLNVVVTGLLSRLWVLSMNILLSLDLLYDKLFLLLNEVTKIQHLAYFKEFSFPVSIRQWFGLSYSKIIEMKFPSLSSQMSGKLSKEPGLLDKLFSGPEPLLLEDDQDATPEGNKMNDSIIPKTNQILDIGLPEQNQTLCEIEIGFQLGKGMKSQQLHSPNYSENIEKFVKEFNCSLKKNKQLHPLLDEFVRRIGATQTFSVLCRELQTIFHWFRRRKLKHGTCYLGNQFLRCQRLGMVEALGYSFPKKFHFIKMAICRYLTEKSRGKLHQDKMFEKCKSTVTLLQNYKMRQSKLYKILPRIKKSALGKKWTRVRRYAKNRSKRTLHTAPRFAFDAQAAIKRLCVTGDMSAELAGNNGLYQNLKNMAPPLGSVGGGSAVLPKMDDDIDDIFASIGI
ncbi:nucleolus and neural progenitor protein isoform X2 [Mustelus asterias]